MIPRLDDSPLSWLTIKWALEEPTDLHQLRQRLQWFGEMLSELSDREFLRDLALPFARRALESHLRNLGKADYSLTQAERLVSVLLGLEPRYEIPDHVDVYRIFPITTEGPTPSSKVCKACGIEPTAEAYSSYCASASCSYICVGCGSREPVDRKGAAPSVSICAACAAAGGDQ